MAIPENRLSKMINRLKEEGFRLTPQRMAVVKILASNEEHLSAEKIHERVRADSPFTSLATIYKTLNLLKDMGEVLELNFPHTGNRYDGYQPYPHPHVVCTRCGQILDSEFPAMAEFSQELAQETGYEITHHQLTFFGLCPKCRQQG